MSVDLGDLVANIKLEVNPPGSDLFPDASDEEWTDRLANAFWNARIDGLLPGYVEADGLITPTSGDTDMPRDLQQVIVFMAAYSTLFLKLLGTKTTFRAKAGAVEYETGQSAQVLRDLAMSLKERYEILLARLSDLGIVPTYAFDSYIAREESLRVGEGYWIGAGHSGAQLRGGF
jgi:hypothetical protein